MIRTITALILFLAASWLWGVTAACAGTRTDGHDPAALHYVVGPQNPEDLLQVGSSRWIIASGLTSWTHDPNARGHIYLVDSHDGSFEVLFPRGDAVARPDRQKFAGCPGPIDPDNFSAHGLALKATSPGRFRLYMTSHGAREAVEVFDVDAQGGKPAIAWVGCVLLPARMWGNSVAILSDGGFLVTKSKDSTNPDAFKQLVEQRITGEVFEWHPGGSVQAIDGTRLSCPNGIALSADDRWMFVTAMGTHEVVRFDRKAARMTGEAVSVSIYPDNVHWGDDGMLYVMGRNYVPQPGGVSCPLLNCGTGWSVVQVDPTTLAVRRMTGADQTVPLQAPSAVITVGDRFWIGNFDGDRIGYMQRPNSRR